MSWNPSRLRLLAGPVLAAALGAPLALAEDRGLKPSYDFVIEADGTVDNAWSVLATEQKTRLLVVAPKKEAFYLVIASDHAVRPVDRSLVMSRADGSVDLLAGAVSASRVFPLEIKGADASFLADGRQLTLRPRPPLLGLHSLDELVRDRPTFGEGMRKYQPESGVIDYLRKYPKSTEITVYFGSWCPVCEAWVPRFLKSVQEAANAKIDVRLYGVPRDFANDAEIARKNGIRGLPTFIVRQDGVEVGRIVGAPDTGTMEAAVANVLKARS